MKYIYNNQNNNNNQIYIILIKNRINSTRIYEMRNNHYIYNMKNCSNTN